MTTPKNVLGQADHAPEITGWRKFVLTARKAIAAFVASGVLAGFGESLAHFDFSDLSWGNLWTGLVSGLISATLVYIVRNVGFIKVNPAVEKTVEQVVKDKFGPGYSINDISLVDNGQAARMTVSNPTQSDPGDPRFPGLINGVAE